MTFTINAQDIEMFARTSAQAWGKYKINMTKANKAIQDKGISMAQMFAPHKNGPLKDSIKAIGGITADFAEFGTTIVYNWQREEGGTIEGNPYLRFKVKGRMVTVASVHQDGSHYMAKTMVPLRPYALYQWGLAIDAVLKAM